ncbi:RICIN domain-containing protein [Streptomyces sp. NPDC058301]|uniref:RICIN domain-containing protein n=1 Tax=Streptomyces sp. NPDC058301 TaxID=3346436 RepID=UPI0036E9A7AD
MAAVVAAILIGFTAPTWAANLEEHHPLTYNMQGGTAYNESKWTSDIVGLLQHHDIVALQEAGPHPPGTFQSTYRDGQLAVDYYTWRPGSSSRGQTYHIYFMETDPIGHRVNLAIVTQEQADGVWMFPAAFATSRPAFGVRLGRTVFVTLHGLSRRQQAMGGNDDARLLNTIDQTVRPWGYDWAALGDYNRDPDNLTVPANSYIYRSHQATQQNGGELDYMVASRAVNGYSGRRLNGLSPDHYPVDFTTLRAAAEFSLGSYSNDGRVLDVEGSGTKNGTHIITYTDRGSANQKWNFRANGNGTYSIVSSSSNKCLDVNGGTSARNGAYVHEWDCGTRAHPAQAWILNYWASNPGQIIIKNSYSGRCLEVLGNKTGDGAQAGASTCTTASNQRWAWEDRDPSDLSPN